MFAEKSITSPRKKTTYKQFLAIFQDTRETLERIGSISYLVMLIQTRAFILSEN